MDVARFIWSPYRSPRACDHSVVAVCEEVGAASEMPKLNILKDWLFLQCAELQEFKAYRLLVCNL